MQHKRNFITIENFMYSKYGLIFTIFFYIYFRVLEYVCIGSVAQACRPTKSSKSPLIRA